MHGAGSMTQVLPLLLLPAPGSRLLAPCSQLFMHSLDETIVAIASPLGGGAAASCG